MSKGDINVFLDKNKIKALPENLKIEEYSIYEEPESSEQVQNLDQNTNVNTYDQPQEEPEIHETFTEDEKDYPSGIEIEPPISPKVSDHATVNKKRQTSVGHNEKSNRGGIYSPNNSTTKRVTSSNDRMPVYIGKEKEIDEETQTTQKQGAKEIGDKGENFILDNPKNYLLSEENCFEKAPVNNKGFDMHERNAAGNTVRYIEVKTLTGKWGSGGVGVTVSQLEFAQKNKDWWLFVVENINTNNTNVFQFENPILKANKFMFDNSWKQLAHSSKTDIVKNTPKVGDRYDLGENDNIYEVLNVKEKGKFYLLKLRASVTQEIINKKFSPSWKKQ